MSYFLIPRPLRRSTAPGFISRRNFVAQAGFSIIELLVVCAILVLITGLVLVNNSRFGGVMRLESLAYDIGLSIRQAQVYGISVARFGTNTYSAGYGMRFDTSSPNSYIFFGDAVTSNGTYESGELLKTTNIQGGYVITQLCVTPSGGSENCVGITTLDVLFIRPQPDAIIAANGTSCLMSPFTCYSRARIRVQSPRGDLMSIIVYNNGQISVQAN